MNLPTAAVVTVKKTDSPPGPVLQSMCVSIHICTASCAGVISSPDPPQHVGGGSVYYELVIMSFTANSDNEEKWWRNKRQDDWLTD